ncbi:MAG: hypothetical protein A3I68_01475 [Candidatus Melainabacteria bacterium RIFCSPLOWO2_02_FULL_35_15]|nr:MAG: hypothetical protein A3F80_04785 [Candidatus Melainabacteria bacterium RIFCSPLOWO2_12_FULL_35_11]OGI12984.1 MAG: hypothetical protein A3I68_01475 [Candidatus Melainabacteria bacterium RIFCSPLOWO2_02_FULL_35_15]
MRSIQNFKNIFMEPKIILCLMILVYSVFSCNYALAWTVAPVRFEIKGQKGKEYTLTFSVLNESQLYEKRFEIQTDDWIINKNNDFLRKAFTPEIENKYSATSWIKVTPMQFVVPPGETKNIRFTISVPNNVSIDGDYSAGIFVGEKNIEKPPKGEKVVHIKQDTFIGVIVYVKLGEEKHSLTLKNLEVKSKSVSNGLNKVTILPTYESRGNVHSRGQIQVKLEPLSKTAAESEDNPELNAGEVVILRESAVTYPIDLPDPLPVNSEWKITVKTDFGSYTPVLVGTKTYKVPLIEQKPETKKQETEKKEIKKS